MVYCGERTLVNERGSPAEAISLRCRSWGCPDCQPRRQSQLIALGKSGYPHKILTLTHVRKPGLTADQCARDLARAWRLVRLRWMRLQKLKRLPFLAVFEATQAGWPHLHILIRAPFIPQALLSSWMRELCASPVVGIEVVRNRSKAGAYVAKYIGKGPGRFGTCKRYWQSPDWEVGKKAKNLEARRSASGFDAVKQTIEHWARGYEQQGWSVTFTSKVRAKATSPPWWIDGS